MSVTSEHFNTLPIINNSELNQLLSTFHTIINKSNLHEDARIEVEQLLCLILECDENKQHDRDKIESMQNSIRQLGAKIVIKDSEIIDLQNKIRQLEAELIIKDKEIKQLKDYLAESKRNSYVLALKEWCKNIEIYCIGKALNISRRKLKKEHIENYSDFREYLDETYQTADERQKYLDCFAHEKRLLGITSKYDRQMAIIRKARNRIAHPTDIDIDIDIDITANFLKVEPTFITKLIELKDLIIK